MKKSCRDKLRIAETLDCGLLRKAAELRKDESILRQIRSKDCVAIEVKYHDKCYKTYTRFVGGKEVPVEKAQSVKTKYNHAYSKFCDDVIEKTILEEKKVYSSKALFQKFVAYVLIVEDLDASNYRTSRLKMRLQNDYPDLVFFPRKQRNECELVYSRFADIGDFLYNDEWDETCLMDSEPDDDVEYNGFSADKQNINSLPDLYKVAQQLRSHMANVAKFPDIWPPTSADININSAKELVPLLLYNFLAWALNKSSVPDFENFVEVKECDEKKIFSLAQDMIFIMHNGRKNTPKSVALSMAVRQITGSSSLIDILNGFGHCCSHSSTLRHDTALAQMSIQSATNLPIGLETNSHTILVWDNADFGEEAKTSTHITNGIAIQQKETNSSFPNQSAKIEIQKSQKKTLSAPETKIPPFFMGKRKSPNFVESLREKSIDEDDYVSIQDAADKCDIGYVLLKMYFGSSFPDWTGFNTLLCDDDIGRESKISYLPVVDAPPTDYSTINAIFARSLDITLKLNVEYAVLVFDESIYAKAQHVRWKSETYMEKFIVRLGDFHTTMTFCGTIGKLFKDCGLEVNQRSIHITKLKLMFFANVPTELFLSIIISVKSLSIN